MTRSAAAKPEAPPSAWAWALLFACSTFALVAAVLLGFA